MYPNTVLMKNVRLILNAKLLYMEFVDELRQDELVPLGVRRRGQDVREDCVHRVRLMLRRVFKLPGKSDVPGQLEAFILRTKRTHGVIRPHRPQSWITER